MPLKRKQVGEVEKYHSRKIAVLFIGPDLLCAVNGEELPNFYMTAEAARIAGRKYVDDQIKVQEQRNGNR